MIVALAAAFFILGFGAAVISSTNQSIKPIRHSILRLLHSLKLGAPDHKSFSDLDFDTEKKLLPLSHTVSGDVSREQPTATSLLTKSQVEGLFEASSWQALAYKDFKDVLLAKENGMKTFPCVYGTMGLRSNDHRYIFLSSPDLSSPSSVRIIAPALRQYLSTARTLGPNTSLVIFAAPSETEQSVEGYNQSFWSLLRGLRTIDTKAWPSSIPQATDSSKWTFCFDGEPVFPVLLTPAHSARWSRHMSVPIVALQPKWVLDQLLSTPEKRDAATGKVRRLLKEFDTVDVSPDLTGYGEVGTSEARQLCLLDENKTAAIPFGDLDR